jgi:hypothetical protein
VRDLAVAYFMKHIDRTPAVMGLAFAALDGDWLASGMIGGGYGFAAFVFQAAMKASRSSGS